MVGASVRVILHAGPRTLALGEREWTVLRQADGTRDLEGIRLAAARAGAPVRLEHVRAFFAELERLGLLDDPPEGPEEAPAFAPDRPVVELPGYRFRCDGRGACCTQFDTVLFAPLEVARARAARPDLGDAGNAPERAFLPQYGVDWPISVVTRQDGACLYFDSAEGCRIHAVKPLGCRTFPARYVDVGDVIRVAPRPECACVFASARRGDGEPLSPARRGSELPRETFVPALPPRLRLGRREVDRAELLAFLDDARARVEEAGEDLARLAWALADRVEGAPSSPAIGAHLRAAAESAALLSRTHVAWRGESDAVRLGIERVRAALARLDESSLPSAREPEDERLYLRSALFLALGAERGIEHELRERAVALWIARAIDGAEHPLALVEALARGHGLALGPHRGSALRRS